MDVLISWKGESIVGTAVETIVSAGVAHCPEGRRIFPGVLLVEQNSAMALDISTRAFVMETGTITLSGSCSALADDPRIRAAYLGG